MLVNRPNREVKTCRAEKWQGHLAAEDTLYGEDVGNHAGYVDACELFQTMLSDLVDPEIVKLRGFIDDRLKENLPPLQDIPDDHLPVIAKLVHER